MLALCFTLYCHHKSLRNLNIPAPQLSIIDYSSVLVFCPKSSVPTLAPFQYYLPSWSSLKPFPHLSISPTLALWSFLTSLLPIPLLLLATAVDILVTTVVTHWPLSCWCVCIVTGSGQRLSVYKGSNENADSIGAIQ